ncbi:MAG: hypothetical protein M1814_006778 [Vezdaea aestivalis]|nr:MAG: hypothetical protein M1814_006778 [Vezdaea aestivalis]
MTTAKRRAMHILLVNDDGPPSPESSPHILPFVKALRSQTPHKVSVVLPNVQRSWIGKAHMVGQTVTPTYYDPSTATVSDQPRLAVTCATAGTDTPETREDEWVLLDGTPASCAQIGLYHFFQSRGLVDVVLSGPNYGRNTTAAFALSSGTLGGAQEAAVCGFRAIAISFAHTPGSDMADMDVSGSCRLSVNIVESLLARWEEGVDLYSVNVPIDPASSKDQIFWTKMLGNKWSGGSCFQEVTESQEGLKEEGRPDLHENEIRKGVVIGQDSDQLSTGRKKFLWAPRFSDVYASVEAAGPGNDGWAVKQGYTSITALRANFMAAGPQQGEFKLKPIDVSKPSNPVQIGVIVDYQDAYVEPLIWQALSSVLAHGSWTAFSNVSEAERLMDPKIVYQFRQYEDIDFEHLYKNPATSFANSYVFRKALIRKHYLSALVLHWTTKHPGSVLKETVKIGESFELDYAEFLDDALIECWDLRQSLIANMEREAEAREWWILKPGMSDKGQGIRLFSSMQELEDIFLEQEANEPESDVEGEDGSDPGSASAIGTSSIVTSHLRHFLVQPYIHPPLLIDLHKFHVRAYVVCVGAMQVYISREMLALFGGSVYRPPWENPDPMSFLTNTCLQGGTGGARRFWDLPPVLFANAISGCDSDWKEVVFDKICKVTAEVFTAAALGNAVDFQPLSNAFEVFGIDFLIDSRGTAWLLEVNAFPDFGQTGPELKGRVVLPLFQDIITVSFDAFIGQNRGQRDKTRVLHRLVGVKTARR